MNKRMNLNFEKYMLKKMVYFDWNRVLMLTLSNTRRVYNIIMSI